MYIYIYSPRSAWGGRPHRRLFQFVHAKQYTLLWTPRGGGGGGGGRRGCRRRRRGRRAHAEPSCAQRKLMSCHVTPSWAHRGLMLCQVVPCWAILGPCSAHVGLCWAHLGPILGPSGVFVGPMLRLCWPMLGLCWPILADVAPMLGLCWPLLGLGLPMWALCWASLGAMLGIGSGYVGDLGPFRHFSRILLLVNWLPCNLQWILLLVLKNIVFYRVSGPSAAQNCTLAMLKNVGFSTVFAWRGGKNRKKLSLKMFST